VHKLCQESAPEILAKFEPQLMIAIGGGGYVPARILRSFLKKPGSPNIPIQAIGLSLYERLPSKNGNGSSSGSSTPGEEDDGVVEEAGTQVTRTQWLDMSALGELSNLVGKRVLIVDEVDDTRTTLDYAVRELQKDVEEARAKLGIDAKTEFSIFVLHVSFSSQVVADGDRTDKSRRQNKDKPKKGHLPEDILNGRYLAARTVGDEWICYPWEAQDIDLHDKLAAEAKAAEGQS
jgi:hypoxanthine phosphoribosyltransferase